MKIILKDKYESKIKTKSIILVLGLILVVLAGIFSPITNLSAETYKECTDAKKVQEICKGLEGDPNNALDVASGKNTGAGKPTPTCASEWFWTPTCAMWGILQVVSGFIFRIGAFILWLAGMILNFVLTYTIVDMAAHINGGTSSFTTPGLSGEIKAMTGINQAWKIIRDLMNIAFIFLLVYEGIKMIIGQSDVAKVKTFITGIVLASLLINFSLFFTKVMIDASNVITIGLYNSIITDTTQDIAGGGDLKENGEQKKFYSGLSVPYMVKLGISDFTSTKSFEAAAVGGEGNLVLFNLMGAIVFLVVAFVFFAVSAMFVIRYITLIFLLMLSPIAFMGLAPLPFISTYTKQWWDSLNGQLLFAPIYMIMNVIILTLMGTPGFLSSTGGWGHLLSSSDTAQQNGAIGLIFNFVVVIGFIILSLVVAKSTSTQGSKFIGQATGKLTTFAGGALMGGAAASFRGTVGRAGQAVGNSQWLKERAPTNRFARMTLSAGKKTGSASLDIRGTKLGTSMGMGDAGGKGGYQAATEAKIKDRMAFSKEMNDTITGTDVENEMNRRGYGKAQNERLGRTAYEVENIRRQVQTVLISGAEANTNRRQERYLHNISQTRWYTPNLYSGVSEDAEAARRLRAGQKIRTSEQQSQVDAMTDALKAAGINAPTPPNPAPQGGTGAGGGAGGNTPPPPAGGPNAPTPPNTAPQGGTGAGGGAGGNTPPPPAGWAPGTPGGAIIMPPSNNLTSPPSTPPPTNPAPTAPRTNRTPPPIPPIQRYDNP